MPSKLCERWFIIPWQLVRYITYKPIVKLELFAPTERVFVATGVPPCKLCQFRLTSAISPSLHLSILAGLKRFLSWCLRSCQPCDVEKIGVCQWVWAPATWMEIFLQVVGPPIFLRSRIVGEHDYIIWFQYISRVYDTQITSYKTTFFVNGVSCWNEPVGTIKEIGASRVMWNDF